MRAVIQRVSHAKVEVNKQSIAIIQHGLMILLGIEAEDTHEDLAWLARKIVHMRIFSDENGHMNKSCLEVAGEILVVSQFTLHASTKKGNRPSFIKAAPPAQAEIRYQEFIDYIQKNFPIKVETGKFGAMMQVSLLNDGPVTIFMDSKNKE
jgi:D-tyrosyl-tRNA(Tyr) deacylase